MSHSMTSQPVTTESAGRPERFVAERRKNEFDYHPIPPLAPVTLFLGVLSGLSLLSELMLPLALAALVCGFICLRQIRGSGGEFGGAWLVRGGLVLAVVFFITGTASFAYAYATEVPEGYRRVNFFHDISAKGFVYDAEKGTVPHPDVQRLIDQKIFLKGYVWTTRSNVDLGSFILLKDNGACCFGGNPAAQDHMLVQMQDGRKVDYLDGRVYVAGVLRYNASAAEGEPVYVFEATHYGQARTAY